MAYALPAPARGGARRSGVRNTRSLPGVKRAARVPQPLPLLGFMVGRRDSSAALSWLLENSKAGCKRCDRWRRVPNMVLRHAAAAGMRRAAARQPTHPLSAAGSPRPPPGHLSNCNERELCLSRTGLLITRTGGGKFQPAAGLLACTDVHRLLRQLLCCCAGVSHQGCISTQVPFYRTTSSRLDHLEMGLPSHDGLPF